MKNLEDWQERDYRRQRIVENAVQAADKIILDRADGSVEEVDYLTGEVARKFVEKALYPFGRDILEKDMKDDIL